MNGQFSENLIDEIRSLSSLGPLICSRSFLKKLAFQIVGIGLDIDKKFLGKFIGYSFPEYIHPVY